MRRFLTAEQNDLPLLPPWKAGIVEQAQSLSGMIARYNVGESGSDTSAFSEARPERRSSERPWSGRKAPAKSAGAPALKAAAGGGDWTEF